MRRVGKQIVAITLATAMMGSLTPEACTFLQNEVVYAAETNGALYESNAEKTVKDIDFSSLTAEDWGKKAEVTYAYTNDTERNVKPNFDLKTRVKISADAYQTLETILSCRES
jgi:mannan endo-1,4-beta-mannosidase